MIEGLKAWVFSLQGKFTIVAFVCILVFTITGSFFILSRETSFYRADMKNQGKALAEMSRLILTNVMVYNELGMMNNQDLVDFLDYFILNFMEQDKRVEYVMILDNMGWVLAHSNIFEYGKNYTDRTIREANSDLKTEIIFKGSADNPVLSITMPLNIDTKNWGVLQFRLSTKEMQESINTLKKEITILNIIFSILALIIISVGARVLSKPVTRLSEIMDGIKTHGDLEHQNFEIKDRRDEIGKLQNSFMWMAQRLKEADREHKETLEVLSQTEKMVSIGRLASGVAHEVNNPLSGVMLCFENLLKTDVDGKRREELVEAVNEGHQKIKHVVEQLLNFSRMSVTGKTTVDLNEQLSSLLMFIEHSASKKNVKIVIDFGDDIPMLNVDKNKISQVFLNITINSLQSMEDGGVLTIRTRQNDGFCMVSMEDTGGGIPPEIMPHIFEPFYTSKKTGEGTGLGLSVSKGIVEQHGGVIEVESKVGVGTTFRISLPASQSS